MKTKDIKTIDVITKTWFDKINGNTYFAQRITINRGRKSESVLVNRFQYGYSSYDYFAKKYIKEALNLRTDIVNNYNLCSSRGKIKFYNEVIKNCKKRDLLHIND